MCFSIFLKFIIIALGQAINEREVEKQAKLIDKTVVSLKCTLLGHDGNECGAVVSEEIREPSNRHAFF